MVSIIIPTLNASAHLPGLLTRLCNQTVTDKELIIIDSSSTDDTAEIAKSFSAKVIIIPQREFNHGGTRNLGAGAATGDILAFMTQDVLPADEFYLEKLIRPLEQNHIAAGFARQLPKEDAIPPEKFARAYNYPDKPVIKGKEDIRNLGIKTFFLTNVCSAIKKDAFFEAGRFPEKIIMDEDLVFAAKLVLKGYKIAYVPDAKVYHSHNYTLPQQFKRYFDIGAALNGQRWILDLVTAEGSGIKYLKDQISYLWTNRQGRWLFYAVAEAAAKFGGYRIGLMEDKLPAGLKRRLSMHSFFWDL